MMSEADKAYKDGMAAAIEDDYETAQRLYDEAIEKNPKKAEYYVARAQNNIKLKNWIGRNYLNF